jgi:four helix bundle protein
MEKVDIREIAFVFALDIINLYKECIAAKEYVLSKQLLKSGTSIGANVEEAQAAQTKNDFIAKMAIASKEARETKYWLRLLKEGKFLKDGRSIDAAINKPDSIINIITKIVKTAMRNNNEKR